MGLEIAVVMDFRRCDSVLREKFTSLEAIVYPMVKPKDGCMPVFQILDMYSVRKAPTEMEQWRMIFSDAEYYIEAVLAPELMKMQEVSSSRTGRLCALTVVEFKLYECLHYEFMKRVVIILDMKVLKRDAELVGDPNHFLSA